MSYDVAGPVLADADAHVERDCPADYVRCQFTRHPPSRAVDVR